MKWSGLRWTLSVPFKLGFWQYNPLNIERPEKEYVEAW